MGLCYVNAKWHGSLFKVMELGDFRQQLTACFHRDERLVSSDAWLHLRVGWRAAKGLSEGGCRQVAAGAGLTAVFHPPPADPPLSQPQVQRSVREATGVHLEDQDRLTCTGIKTVIN